MPNNASDFMLPVGDLYALPPDRRFKYHTDDYFRMGSAHHVCQDYSRSFDWRDYRAVVVSDGCSSAPDTDFGSRYMVLSAIDSLTGLGSDYHLRAEKLFERANFMRSPQLPVDCLDATLLAAYAMPSGYVKVQVFGDGVVVIRHRDGSTLVCDIDQSGAPSYPAYFVNADRMKAFKDAGYGGRKINLTIDGVAAGVMEQSPDALETCPAFEFMLNPMTVDLVALMSDGAKSFQDISGISPKDLPLAAVLPYLTGFKNLTGAFVGRRVNAFLTREMPKLNWRHYDDLAVAALYMEEIQDAVQAG